MAIEKIPFDFKEYNSTLDKDKKYKGLEKKRRSDVNKKKYDKLQKLEKQKAAIDKLQSDEFSETLRRYYSGGITDANNAVTGGKDIKDFTKTQLIEKFYQDRIWSEWNTVGIANDVGQVLAKDQQYKGDWAEITQLYADLPYFGGETIGFKKWAKDFVPALLADPINLFSFGAGKVVAQQGAKTVLKEVSKKEFVKSATTKAAINVGMKEAAMGTAVGVGADALRQSAEIDANLTSDYNVTRTLLAGLFGGGAQGVFGAGLGAWSAKGKAGKFYDKGDGFKGDLDRDVGNAGTLIDETWSGESGKNVKQKANKKVKKPEETKQKPSETQAIDKKVKEIKRKTPVINLSKFGEGKDTDDAVKELVEGINKIVKDGDIDTKVRKGLLKEIFEGAQIKLSDAKALQDELLAINKIAPELAPTITAGRMNLINKAKEVAEIRKLADEAIDPNEKLILADKLVEALTEKTNLIIEHVTRVRGVSDALQSQKLEVKVTDADKLRMEFDKEMADVMPQMIDEIKQITDPKKKIDALDNLARLSENDEVMRKVLRNIKRKKRTSQVRWTEALNEYATANILGDVTTHLVNLSSAGIRFQVKIINDFMSGFVNVLGVKNYSRGFQQMHMAGDLFAAQFMFFKLAAKKAAMSWKANRAIGDTIEHQFDGKQTRNMETYLKQLREQDSIIKRTAGIIGSPIAKFSFLTLKGLQAGDSFMKNIFQRAQRVANVNQRMRTFYPDLYKTGKFGDKQAAIKIDEKIINIKENIRFEESKLIDGLSPRAKKKIELKIKKLNNEITKQNKQRKKLTSFQEKWNELYFQYEDEFGNFRETGSFSNSEIKDLDDLTKSVANDPTYNAQESSFTQALQNRMLDANQFFPDQKQSAGNIGNVLLKAAQNNPLIRVLTGLHFVKTPVNLLKYGWQMTPVFNRLNMEFNAMRTASDPVVRSKAQGIQATGAAVYGFAFYAAGQGLITGWDEKDPKQRFSYKYTDEEGKTRYVNLKRYFPLSIPFMVAASINEAKDKMGHMWEDPLYSQEQGMVIDFMRHYAGSAFSLWSHIFASNLMTQDFFKLMSLISDTDVSNEEGEVQVETLRKHFSRQTSKLIPMATQWRWQNKALGEAEAELIDMKDHLIQSSPHELLSWINKNSGANLDSLNFGNALSPKRDLYGNPYPAPKGLLLGTFQDPLTYYTGVSTNMKDSNGKQLVYSEEGKRILENLNVNWKAPLNTIPVGLANRLDMKKAAFIDFTKNKHFSKNDIERLEGATMWSVVSELKGKVKMKIHGKKRTLNEAVHYMIENKHTEFNKYYRDNPMVRGKYVGAEYIKGVIREYEKLARDFMLQHAIVEYKGRVLNINEDKSFADKIEKDFMKKESKNNKKFLDSLLND